MRTEREMIDLILNYALTDARVRAVGMNGSRVNKNVPKDCLQDYDIAYLVTDMNSFIRDKNWIDYFGKRIILQTPEQMSLFPPELSGWFSYLMLFEDGNRIDLTLIPIEELVQYLKKDKLTRILLDKDGGVATLPEPSDADFHVTKPTAAHFDDCCNEFWWVSTYVAKGLCRGEILFAAEHLNNCVRPQLLCMLSWKVGIETEFSLSVGKCHKYLKNFLSQQAWEDLLSTYRADTYVSCRTALYTALRLFRLTSKHIAAHFGYPYPDYDRNVTAYIRRLSARFFKEEDRSE